MPAERPTDIVMHEIKVTDTEVAPDDHGVITIDEEQVHHAEAAVEVDYLEDGRQRVTIMLGTAEVALTYDRESLESAERAAVLMVSLPNMLVEIEEQVDAAEAEPGE